MTVRTATLAVSHPLRTSRTLALRARDDSLLRNSLFVMATTVTTAAFGYLFWLAAARGLPTHVVGTGAAMVSAMMLSATAAILGVHATLVQTLPDRPSGRPWARTVNMALLTAGAAGLICGIVVAAALPVAVPALADLHRPWVATAFVLGVPLTTVSTAIDYIYVAERQAGRMLARNLAWSLVRLPLLVVPMLLLPPGPATILVAWVAACVPALAYGAVLVRGLDRGYGATVRGWVAEARATLPTMARHHLINLSANLPSLVLPILVTARVSSTDNAYFYVAWMMGSIFFIISPAVSWALFAEGSHDAGGLPTSVRRSAVGVGTLLAPLIAGVLLLAPWILDLFGPAYAHHGATLLRVLALSAIPDAVTNLCVAALRVRRRLAHAAALNWAMALGALGLAWALLPSIGIVGAGWAWLAAQTAGAAWVAVLVLRSRRRARVARRQTETACAS